VAALAAGCDESSVSQELSPAGVEGLHGILALEVGSSGIRIASGRMHSAATANYQ
jgi:hypothetical protein